MFRSLFFAGFLATLVIASCTFRPSPVPFVEGQTTTYPNKGACWRALRERHMDVVDSDRPHMAANASIESLRNGQEDHLVGLNVVRLQRMGGRSERCEVSRCFVREEWCTSVDDLHLRFARIRQDPTYLEKHAFWLLRQHWFQVFMHELTPHDVRVHTAHKDNGTHMGLPGLTWRLSTQWLHGLATRVHAVVNASWVTTNTGANASCTEGPSSGHAQ